MHILEIVTSLILKPPEAVHHIRQATQEFVIVDKFTFNPHPSRRGYTQYYITPEGWSSSLEVTPQMFLSVFLGDIVSVTYSTVTRKVVQLEKLGKVPPGYALFSSAPNLQHIEKDNIRRYFPLLVLTFVAILLGLTLNALSQNSNNPLRSFAEITIAALFVGASLFSLWRSR